MSPHLFCHKMQVKSMIEPNKMGPGIEPRALMKRNCTPTANDLKLGGTTLKKLVTNQNLSKLCSNLFEVISNSGNNVLSTESIYLWDHLQYINYNSVCVCECVCMCARALIPQKLLDVQTSNWTRLITTPA